jgi:hypothetical protein
VFFAGKLKEPPGSTGDEQGDAEEEYGRVSSR